MPYNGSGTFVRLRSWLVEKAQGSTISAQKFDDDGNDVASALSNCVTRDGESPPTADLPMAGHTLTGIRQGAANGEPVEWSQLALAGGTSNLLHNATFTINQRAVSGTVVLAAGKYGHDRWKAGASGCTYTFSKSGPDTTLTITAGSLLQVVSGDDIDSGSYTLQSDGTAQGRVYTSTPSGFAANPQQATLSGGVAVSVEFATGTVLRPQLVAGSVAKSFARRNRGAEMALCLQYFCLKTLRLNMQAGPSSPTSMTIDFALPMATVPSTGNVDISGLAFGGLTSPSVSATSTTAWTLSGTPGGTGFSAAGTWSASCEP